MPQMRGAGLEDVLVVLQVPGNKAGAVPCKYLRFFYMTEMIFTVNGQTYHLKYICGISKYKSH
jgi:hypothetical protein